MNALLLYWKPIAMAVLLLMAGIGGYRTGANSVRIEWEHAAAESARQYAAALKQGEEHAAAENERHTQLLAQVDTAYQTVLKEKDDALNAALARARAGGLYVHAQCPANGSDTLPETTSSASLGHGLSLVRLSTADGEFFERFASEADAVADQLRACQQVVKADRE